MSDTFPRDGAGNVRFPPPPGLTRWPPVQNWTEIEWAHWLTLQGWTPEQIAQYLDHDRFEFGVGFTPKGERARAHNAYAEGVRWLYKPTPRGVTLHATRYGTVSNFLWGGSAGGTKSYSARWEAIAGCLWTERDDYRVIILRRELEELRRTHLDKIDREAQRLCEALGNSKAIKVTQSPPVFSVQATGAKIIFGHAAHDGDEDKYLSEDYDLAIGDESTQMRWKQLIGVGARLRNDPKMNYVARFILTTNPGGPSHQETVDHFIAKCVTLEQNEKYDPSDYQFVQARLYDNPFYMDPDGTFSTYIKRLYMYDPERRKQLLDGDWGAIVDAFFQKFSPSRHVREFAA